MLKGMLGKGRVTCCRLAELITLMSFSGTHSQLYSFHLIYRVFYCQMVPVKICVVREAWGLFCVIWAPNPSWKFIVTFSDNLQATVMLAA
jgi:hypothetical protein